jgi:hypothetical protein
MFAGKKKSGYPSATGRVQRANPYVIAYRSKIYGKAYRNNLYVIVKPPNAFEQAILEPLQHFTS